MSKRGTQSYTRFRASLCDQIQVCRQHWDCLGQDLRTAVEAAEAWLARKLRRRPYEALQLVSATAWRIQRELEAEE